MKSLNWRVFFTLLLMSVLSVFAVFPYVLSLQGDIIRQIGQPIVLIFVLQLFQSIILFSIAIFIGLYLIKKINFHLPFSDGKAVKDTLSLSVILGFITAVIIYGTDYLFTFLGSAISTNQNLAPVWQKLLAAFYGGVSEEILLRLFVMTLFIWIGMKITRQSLPAKTVIIISIFLAAIIFGLGHLPITASLTTITPLIIFRAIILNGIGGIVFGWLFWKKGLESAMIAHFTADIFLLTVLPLLFGR